ncbi:putative siderophore-binding lipoprotein YfiY [Paenibacillus nuruki]|uniref:Putative siderophore-binding lipoprotein YfiY n=1 Tax=Paenibacillus nuruki TaxID=1886670 RepID=A0A1E3L1S7_9BACL|nr:ABC transporter substrate-binding protein [Paenibacillus nuruki]ODP27115.1 putative siderophore-binding lipoprotein YfiY [Paenibacillus nuruki]
MKTKNSLVMMSLTFMIIFLVACGQPAASTTSTLSTSSSSGMVKEENGVIIHDAKAKVASMSIHITNNLLALGIQPVGSVIGGDVKDFLPHVADQLKGTQKLGVVTDPDMEALLALQPDVIYIDKEYSSKDLAKFEQIAPTIVIDMDQGTWQDQLKEIATHVGLEKKADTFIADYDTKAAQVSTLIHSRLGADAKVMAIRMTPKELRVMSTARPLGPIMFEDLKLQMADGIDKISKDEPYQVISKEVLPDFNADAIFVIISKGNDAQTNFDELEKNPLWLNLKAVKNKHVYVLDGQKWLDYSSLGQQMALEDATQLFSK